MGDESDGIYRRGELLECIVDNAPFGIFAKDLYGRYLSINRVAARMIGMSPREVLGSADVDVLAPEVAAQFFSEDRTVISTGRAGEFEETVAVDGAFRIFSTSKIPWQEESGTVMGVVGFSVDITERRRVEESLQNERLLLRAIIDNIPDPICAKDLELRKILSNPADVLAMGAGAEAEVLGKDEYEFYPRELADLFIGNDNRALKSGESFFDVEREIPLGRTRERRWILGSKHPLKDKDGRVIGLVGITRDITERKKAELRVKELLAEKELILREVHHRIKNNMGSINSLLSLQRATLRDSVAAQALQDAGNRVASMMVLYDRLFLTEGFLEVSIAQVLPYMVDEIIENCSCPARVTVEKDIADVVLDARQLQPVGLIVNEALTNAMKYAFAGREEGRIRVSVAREGSLVQVEIRDDGVGLPESIGLGRSAGFGLTLIESLTKQLDGRIRVERAGGTAFILEFSS